MLQDRKIMMATSRILQRSEKQEDLTKLIETFVDIGILPQLMNDNNQILYGRRGTGKTHVFKVLVSKLEEDSSNVVVYIDGRTLGSTTQFSDTNIPISKRCLALFRDFMTPIQNAVMEYVVENPNENAEQAFDAASLLGDAIVQPFKTLLENGIRTKSESESSLDLGAEASVSATHPPGFLGSFSSSHSEKGETELTYRVESEDKVIFPVLSGALEKTLRLAQIRLYVLFDEWASLPLDIQPYLAEFLKHGILPVQQATIKIASLEHRSMFSCQDDDKFIGFELGADVSTALDLDDYYVFDRNPNRMTEIYGKMLLKHLSADIEQGYLQEEYSIKTDKQFLSRLFTEIATFRELARAAEGVVRDLINIFTRAFFHANRRNRDSIDRKAIVEAARAWFEQDKAQHLDQEMESVLRRIVDEVIGTRRARSFLLPRNLEKHKIIQKLFDARVLHHMQRGYADKDNPGVRYNIYSLDYGTYVDLLNTSKQPDLNLFDGDSSLDGADVIVPFDDKRSIRRIVLREEILD